MKAYKCDVCKKYCDEVWEIDGLSEPKTHVIGRFPVRALEACEECYDKISQFVIDNMINDDVKQIKQYDTTKQQLAEKFPATCNTTKLPCCYCNPCCSHRVY